MASVVNKQIKKVSELLRHNKSSLGSPSAAVFLDELNKLELYIQENAKNIKTSDFKLAGLKLEPVYKILGYTG
jgi:hypothetical protein